MSSSFEVEFNPVKSHMREHTFCLALQAWGGGSPPALPVCVITLQVGTARLAGTCLCPMLRVAHCSWLGSSPSQVNIAEGCPTMKSPPRPWGYLVVPAAQGVGLGEELATTPLLMGLEKPVAVRKQSTTLAWAGAE